MQGISSFRSHRGSLDYIIKSFVPAYTFLFEIFDEQHGDVNCGGTQCVPLFLSDGHFHGR